MGDLRNVRKKLEQQQRIKDAQDRRENGWAIFHFDFNPKLTRRDLSLGDAIRHLSRASATRISWWRCPIRGLAITYHKLPRTSPAHDSGERYASLHFCDLQDEVEAKKVLGIDALLRGMELYRGLPNKYFDAQVELIRWLLKAPPNVSGEDWLKAKQGLQKQTQPLLRTHEAELRAHLLGERTSANPMGLFSPRGPGCCRVLPLANINAVV